ncbi:MAG: restriction endonuclease subunit S [Acidimicrobiales bacterium]
MAAINRKQLPETLAPDYTFRYVDIGSVSGDGHVLLPDEPISFETAPSRARRLASPGATIVSTVRTYLRAIARVPDSSEPLVFSTGFAVLEPGAEMHSGYLYYACRANTFIDEVVARSTGVSYPAINPADIGDITIEVPPIDDQRRIADFLDDQVARLDRAIELRQRQMALVRKSASSGSRHLIDHLQCNRVPLRYLVQCLDGRRIPLNATERADRKGEVPYWGAGSIVDYIDQPLFDETLVLLGEDGAPFFDEMREVAFLVTQPVWVNNHIHVLRAINGVSPAFLVHALNSVDYAAYITGATRDKLTQEDMRGIHVPVPAYGRQVQLSERLDATASTVRAAENVMQRQVDLFRERKQSLITAAITGEFDVTTARSVV